MRKPEGKRVSGINSVASGLLHHSASSDGLSLEERRQMVHEIAQCLKDAPTVLKSFKKKELEELIYAESKERKIYGYTKPKMIEYLLKLVSKNKETANELPPVSPVQDEKRLNKQQKNRYLSQLPVESNNSQGEPVRTDQELVLCPNLACRASLDADDMFCKRCSCCICHQYDENKDPSLWLTCDNNSPEKDEPCGISCHLKCALEQKPRGALKKDSSGDPDDIFCCNSCRKPYGVMRTWRKQLVAATEARRVDVLSQRLSLSYKILVGSHKFERLRKIVKSAMTALANEVGPLHQASATMDRRIVNRLSCGAEVQKLCASAIEAFDSMVVGQNFNQIDKQESPECKVHFEASSPTKVAIILEYEDHMFKDLLGCRIWHRKSRMNYPAKPTYDVPGPVNRFELCDLDPSTEYFCKVSFFNKNGALGVWEANWKTLELPVDHVAVRENANALNPHAQTRTESMSSSDSKVALSDDLSKEPSFDDSRNKHEQSPTLPIPEKHVSLASPTSNAPSTPCKSDGTQGVPHLGIQRQLKETDYEYAVRVIRKLEHEGHLGSDFRVKFLTWFSLKATLQEKRVVSVFIDTFSNDPDSLAGQLLHTFKDEICNEQKLACPPRFCSRLWH
ncbi:OLC1v1017213C1 [Oldenlandia corymbosa var. corymbosa]|uniref:OLC1v1017213C1 n=1 Tax=Oldenlandia corymbosa var. corymbosa TaxID=529605 RepID=A0AAV1E8X9_OLDCO|nr:OLC1v1017213C1 [Oldenlandia corymbosa var. corymbosa]